MGKQTRAINCERVNAVSNNKFVHTIPILVASLPIRSAEGGVITMMRAYSDLAKERGYSVSHICNTPGSRDSKNRGLLQLLRGKWEVGIEEFEFEGQTYFEVGRRLPIIEPLHYLTNAREWIRIARHFTVLQVISGSNHAGLAFALANRKFICWVATPYDEDKEARRDSWTLARRFVDDNVVTPICRLTEGYIFRKCPQIIALSTYTANIISRRFRIPRDQILVFPCPINTDRFYPPSKRSIEKIILFAGRYGDPRKNAAMLIRAFSRVLKQHSDTRLLLVGDEPISDLRDLVIKLNLNHTIEFHGVKPYQEMISYYQRASVFAIPSLQEGLGIVGLEAMACGLPIVSTRCGGPEDFIHEGVTGFLVPLDDSEAMANRLIKLLTDSALRDQMGERARRYIEEHFSYKALGDTFDKVYRRVYPELFKSNVNENEPFREEHAGI